MTGAGWFVRVSVPATSANLGPGFDSLGLALGLYDVVEVGVAPGGVEVDIEGVAAADIPRDESHLVVRAIRATLAELGSASGGLRLRCVNAIPQGRGLGSSAAAIVAGVLAARELAGVGRDDEAVLATAARLEGHPDNVAPCLLGGLTIAWTAGDRTRAIRADVHPDVQPVVCVPDMTLPTETARGLLPDTVPHADATRTAGRAALLVEALTRRPDVLLDATEDLLHQPYRAPAVPDTLALVHRFRDLGLPAVVSGAGPSVLVLASADQQVEPGPGWEVHRLVVDDRGAVVQTVGPRHDMVAHRPRG